MFGSAMQCRRAYQSAVWYPKLDIQVAGLEAPSRGIWEPVERVTDAQHQQTLRVEGLYFCPPIGKTWSLPQKRGCDLSVL